MDNATISKSFLSLAKLMEFHGENPYKIRSYSNAYNILKKWDDPLVEMELVELKDIPGVGDAIANKIVELRETGEMQTLETFKEKTPIGIQELLRVRGLGPKKIKQLWKELGVDSIGSLYYAANENRVTTLKGFAEKSQQDILNKLDVHMANAHNLPLSKVYQPAQDLTNLLKQSWGTNLISVTGEIRRAMPVVNQIELIAGLGEEEWIDLAGQRLRGMRIIEYDQTQAVGKYLRQFHFTIKRVPPGDFHQQLFSTTGTEEFVGNFEILGSNTEAEIFQNAGSPVIPPECRDLPVPASDLTKLIELQDIKGIVHCHSQYSDGINTIGQMARYAQEQNFEYLVVTDHSRMAFYANGMDEEDVLNQWKEIDALNTEEDIAIPIIKGIECDILTDDQLDYNAELLSGFEVVIASVHSHLKMDIDRATGRLISAIEHPATNIIGHPTGRIYMAREGYSLHWDKVMDACLANQVALELNANPYRLDIDWQLIQMAMDKGVMISINPDAHNLLGMHDIQWGVLMGRKGGLTKESCLTALPVDDFLQFCNKG